MTRRKYHKVPVDSSERLSRLCSQRVPPQHERVLIGTRVIAAPYAGDGKAEPLVQPASRLVRSPNLEGRSTSAQPGSLCEHVGQERGRRAKTPVGRQHREVVDV